MLKKLESTISVFRKQGRLKRDPAVVVAGDFNTTPGSVAHRLLTEGCTSKPFPNGPYPNPSHSLNLSSAYHQAFGSEPEFTTYVLPRLFPGTYNPEGFIGTLDYIFYNDQLRIVSCLEPVPSNVAKIEGAWPSSTEPSDHMPLIADF